MRIVITADLHYRPSQREGYVEFARWVQAEEPDCFILAGDVGHPLRLFQRALQLFGDLSCPKLLLAGNHDVYRGEQDSRTLWQIALPQAALEEGYVWLEDQVVTLPVDEEQKPAFSFGTELIEAWDPTALGDSTLRAKPCLGIVGTMGWYDYSSAAPHLHYTDAEFRALKRLVNHDADFIDWPWSDIAMARYLAKGFEQRLQRLVEDPAVEQILVVTHVPIFRETIPDHPESEFWSLLRTYLGNFTLGDWVRRQPKVTHVVSGHIHHPGCWTVRGDHGPIDFRLVGSHKGRPRAVVLEF